MTPPGDEFHRFRERHTFVPVQIGYHRARGAVQPRTAMDVDRVPRSQQFVEDLHAVAQPLAQVVGIEVQHGHTTAVDAGLLVGSPHRRPSDSPIGHVLVGLDVEHRRDPEVRLQLLNIRPTSGTRADEDVREDSVQVHGGGSPFIEVLALPR